MNIRNKNIVITGGSSGIGLALVKRLAPHNKVTVISRTGQLPEDLVAEYAVSALKLDLADKAKLERVLESLLKQQPVVDIVINNAAVQHTPEFLADDFNYDGIQREVDTNFTSICHLTYLLLPTLLASPNGQIVNINSGLAIAPKRESAIYCATKSALDSFSKSLGYQLAETSVSVSQVFLPLVDTKMTQGRGKDKLSTDSVAESICHGVAKRKKVIDVGKVKLLRVINALAPGLAHSIMKRG